MTAPVHTKRAYEPCTDSDGYRVLVDRLWPRGLSKTTLSYDRWAKDLAPSTDLRKRFGHQAERWKEFHHDYTAELQAPGAQALMDEILAAAQDQVITLLYGAHDTEHNQAVVLADILAQRRTATKS